MCAQITYSAPTGIFFGSKLEGRSTAFQYDEHWRWISLDDEAYVLCKSLSLRKLGSYEFSDN
jgi:hypothetical protein